MLLGALLDAGLPEGNLLGELAKIGMQGYVLTTRKVNKNGFQATKVDISIEDKVTERHLEDILSLIDGSQLPQEVKERAGQVFSRMAEVEARIHGVSFDQVHLHELGGIDTIVDVVGTFIGLRLLGVQKVAASPLPLGRGFSRGAHGRIPLPAPATLALLKGVPITGSEIDFELVTPTGAALLTALADSFGPIPAMTLEAVGYGAGSKDLPIPNVLRVLLGEATLPTSGTVETLALLETNIDDLNPQIYEYVMERVLSAGALDVTMTPVHMKKNRPGIQLTVLCRPADSDNLEAILFAETSTLGLRRTMVERHALWRDFGQVETPYGTVRVKIAHLITGQSRAAPEFEDCKRLANASGASLWDVYRAALAASLDNVRSA